MPPSDNTHPIETAALRPDIANSRCSHCGAEFRCGMSAGDTTCWCADYPHVMPVPTTQAGCYCPACLARMMASRGVA